MNRSVACWLWMLGATTSGPHHEWAPPRVGSTTSAVGAAAAAAANRRANWTSVAAQKPCIDAVGARLPALALRSNGPEAPIHSLPAHWHGPQPKHYEPTAADSRSVFASRVRRLAGEWDAIDMALKRQREAARETERRRRHPDAGAWPAPVPPPGVGDHDFRSAHGLASSYSSAAAANHAAGASDSPYIHARHAAGEVDAALQFLWAAGTPDHLLAALRTLHNAPADADRVALVAVALASLAPPIASSSHRGRALPSERSAAAVGNASGVRNGFDVHVAAMAAGALLERLALVDATLLANETLQRTVRAALQALLCSCGGDGPQREAELGGGGGEAWSLSAARAPTEALAALLRKAALDAPMREE